MLTVGTEISASPKVFVVGAAVDFNSGFSVGLGLTRYEKTTLAKGWRPDQPVPAKEDGTALETVVPTRKDDGIGFYVSTAFRPSVFNAFWRSRTGGSSSN